MVYTKRCIQCGSEYATEQAKKKLCPECDSFNRKRKKKPVIKRREKIKKPALTLDRVCHIEAVYNAVNHTYKHYHEIVRIIEDTRADSCVCCGAFIQEGKLVCNDCERKAEEARRW